MSRFVTLLAVADICLPPELGTSGTLRPSSDADGGFAPAAVLVLFLPKDSFHLDDFFEIDGVAELEDVRERGAEELRRDIGGKAIPGEIGYGMGRTSEAGDSGCVLPEWRDVREISRASA